MKAQCPFAYDMAFCSVVGAFESSAPFCLPGVGVKIEMER